MRGYVETSGEPKLLPAGLSYFEYQRRVGREILIPWLEARAPLDGVRIADFGAHEGGTLEAFRQSGRVSSAVGIELSQRIVASSPFASDDRFRLEVGDLMLASRPFAYDLIVLHDVLEHIPDRDAALRAVTRSLSPGGYVFVSFPPYYSAFGGHQQLARSWARHVPFLHLLPGPLFFRIARPGAQEYMSAESSMEDMMAVRMSRLTLSGALRAFSKAGLALCASELFVVRPEYTIRYGVKARRAGVLGRLPVLRELAVNGAYFLLRQGGRASAPLHSA